MTSYLLGYLTATSSEDWGLVLEVCDRASSNETNAKEAVRALRREFKYGEPPAQLAAARLWAIMLRNSSELFISQSTTRKFLDTIADLLTSQKTSPVVRERLMNVVAAAAYASGNGNSKDGFRGLWRKVKPADKPDDGVPFDTEDAMFSPSVTSRVSQYDSESVITYPPAVPGDPVPGTPPGHKSPTRNRIIPPDEDIRRLFQECKIGRGNASLLSQALAMSRPEDLRKKDIVKEFYVKCRASQELIYAQIPWATAGAERSRVAKDQELQARRRTYSRESANGPEPPHELTLEEKLLDALLAANTELLAALQQYDDLERVAMERKAEQQSRKETRMDRKQLQLLENEGTFAGESRTVAIGGSSSSRSPSPSSQSQSYSPPPSITHPTYHPSDGSQSLMPPPAAPHGPRSPGHLSIHPRTPSPGTPNIENSSLPPHNDYDLQNGLSHLNINSKRSPDSDDAGEVRTAIKPSAKALGKRRLVEPDAKPDSLFASEDRSADDGLVDSDSDDSAGQWNQRINYVYDAAAERTQERIREGHNQLVNGVH
ncbi:hypothetical protein BDN72DRAFT_767546 [Pluteus cervinus]|uniref:Uncharacterized protein n=1 Tax=Pluteus cervinus TaxID=181527 RepID=A0ACD3AW09_9AGAR|nr:hypothetical protein BDN72DRAFT_767546 [Pluteus cervinus]